MAVFFIYLPHNAYATLRAEAEYNFSNADLDYGNNYHQWAHSFTQKYSLLYNTSGKFVDGRLGKYDFLLGYEFIAYDTKASKDLHMTDSSAKGHLLFSGNLTFDPKEMPLKLTLYSRDNRNAIVSTNSVGSASTDSSSVYNFTTGILTGTYLESGATLVAGVKNGMTNGYNEFLRHFPMILLDYKDRINKDINSDNRLTQLAFVSLNKKENWFHYRYSVFNDNKAPENSYKESQMQLGTVDQALQRRWIDFTNWLQVSSDALYINHNSEIQQNNFQEISINLFGVARRQNVDVYMYNSFLRRAEIELKVDAGSNPYTPTYTPSKVFTYTTTVPVYASGVLNPTTRWDASASYNESHTNDARNFTKFNTGYNLYTLSRSPFTFTQGTNIEFASAESASKSNDMIALTTRFETTSTPKFSNKLSLAASDVIKMYRYNQTDNPASDFLQNELSATATYSYDNKLRFNINQRLSNTFGHSGSLSTSIYNANATTSQYQSPIGTQKNPDSTIESVTAAQIYWQPTAQISTSLSLSESVYADNTGGNTSTAGIGTGITYKSNFLTLSSEFAFSQSSDQSRRLTSKNGIKYIYNRNVDIFVNTVYTKIDDKYNEGETTYGDDLYVEQGVNIYFFKTNGVTRKLFEVNEQFKSGKNISNYVLSSSTSTFRGRSNDFSLGVRYYPISALNLGAGTRYSCADSFKPYIANYYFSAALTYQLFESSLDYSYGRNTFSGLIEKKFAVNMKKRF